MDNSQELTKAPQIPLLKTEAKELAGGAMPPQMYTSASECSAQSLASRDARVEKGDCEFLGTRGAMWSRLGDHLQSATDDVDADAASREFNKMLNMVAPAINGLFGKHEGFGFSFVEMMENIRILRLMTRNCVSMDDYWTVLQLSFRLFTKKVFSQEIADKIVSMFVSDVQSSGVEETISMLRSMFDYTTCVTECELSQKLIKLYSFLLTQGYLKKVGVYVSDEDYSKMEQRALLAAFSSKKSFLCCVIDTSLFMCQRLIEYRKSGDATVFLKSGKAFDDWLSSADRILNLGPFVGNLEAHGTSYFSFLADLRDLIEKGEAIAKYTRARSGDDSKVICGKLAKLHLLQNTEITRRSAQSERMAPMAVLISGGSSIAKSSFAKIMFNYYGALFNLEHTDDYRYVRSSVSEYWTNFDSSKWCIQLDDIAFLNPNKCSDIDETLKEVIQVINNVPYVPPQAALEDKGRTPVMAKLVLATTNCEDLNASEYFWCPLAVRRRLPYVIRLKPKPEFTHENGRFIAPEKIITEEGKFSDLWIIEVCKIVPEMRFDREFAQLESVQVFSDISLFLQHFGRACQLHEKHQKSAMAKDKDMLNIAVCDLCLAPLPHVECLVPQVRQKTRTSVTVSDVECMNLQSGEVADGNTPMNLNWKWLLLLPYFPWEYIVLGPLSYLWRGYFALLVQMVIVCYYCRDRIATHLPSLLDVRQCVNVCLNFFIDYRSTRYVLSYAAKYRASRYIVMRIANVVEDERVHMAIVATQIYEQRKEGLKKFVAVLAILSGAFAAYSLVKPFTKPTVVTAPEVVKTDDELDVQAEVSEGDQFIKESSANVWYNPSVELTNFDMPSASTSLVGIDADGVRTLLHKNCVLLHIRGRGDKFKRIMRGVMLAGHKCLTNAHAFYDGPEWFTVRVIQADDSGAFRANQEFEIHRETVATSKTTDLCIFDVECLPPFRDILRFWSDSDHHPTSCVQLRRSDNGSVVEKRSIYNLSLVSGMRLETLRKSCDIYMGSSDTETAIGDCGSLCVAITSRGPYIFGLHILGKEKIAGVLSVKKSEIEALMTSTALSQRPIVQAGFAPLLEVASRKHVLGPLHHKSMIRYVDGGIARVYGSFVGFRPKPKSKVCATPLQAEMLAHYGREVEYGAPAMSGWEPWRNNLITMVRPKSVFDRRILRECSKAYLADMIEGLDSDQLRELVVLSDRAAVNGIPGVKYIDKINTNSSMGFPWCKTKKQFLVADVSSEYPEGVTFEPEVWEQVRHIEREYLSGSRVNTVFFGCLKDEAQPWKKIEIKKTRLFMGGSISWGIVVRKYLLPFVRLVQRNPTLFECSVGLPAQSPAWGSLRDHLTQFGVDRMVAGDYKFFDKEMIAEFILEAFDIIIGIYAAAGVDMSIQRLIACIAEDIAFPICNVNGDLFEFFGSNPSGQPLTVLLNSIVNSLYLRYAFRVLNPEKEVVTFKKKVAATTYGDDNAFGVNKNAPWYNHTTIQSALADIGLTYTMADKTADSVPYIHIDDVSFLKRTWRWNDDVGNYTCPLDEESIIKSLTVWTPSSELDKYAHMLQVLTAANNEYFFHGKKMFEEKHAFFNELLQVEPYSFYAASRPLPTYDQLVARFLGSCNPVDVTIDADTEDEPSPYYESWFANNFVEDSTCESGAVEMITGSIITPRGSEDSHSEVSNFFTIQSSDVVDLPVVEGSAKTSEVVTFVDDSTGQINDTPFEYSAIASSGGTLNTSLEHFLRRPTLIDSRAWTTATGNGVLGSVLEPWFLYLNNAVIRNKLNNYAFLRAKLCLKVVINATPFHFGCMRVAYEPNVNSTNTGDRVSKVRTNATTNNTLIIPYSQLPGVWVLPADDSGGEIHVPYFRHTNWLSLKSAASVKTMGNLTYYVAFPLTVASTSGSTSVTINTFAWLEDVELGGSTSELTLQAKDEYDGVVSAPARAVATAAAHFTGVPIIGKFAKATTIGAGAISSIAGLFGFTNTPVIDNVHGVVPMAGVHLASSEIGTPVQKLTLDPKQELSIDPTMHGISSDDQMAIDYITKKKSTLVMDGWSTSDGVGTVLFNARVSPQLFGRVDIVDGGAVKRADRVYHSPMSYIGMMFTHWRGDIVFEIEVICTKFHKGRLKIAWDPIGSGGAVALDENTVFTTILDIGENNKALFRVPFHQAHAWCRTRGISVDNWTVGNANPVNELFDNGLFIVSVLTPLMSPVSPQNVGVKISAYSASVEFANPRSTLGENGVSAPPSFFAIQSADVQDVEATMVTFGDVGVDHPKRFHLNFGERVVSLRTLLHRYSLYDVSSVGADAATRTVLYHKSYSRHPPMFGFDPQGKSTANKALSVGTGNFTFAPTHPMTYVALMYGGVTGGVNYVVNTSGDLYPYLGDVRVQRITDSSRAGERNGVVFATINSGTTTSAYNRFMNFAAPGNAGAGATFTNSQTNASVNWNYPMMTGTNLNYPDPGKYLFGNTADQTDRECCLFEAYIKQDAASSVSKFVSFTTYAASGPDYNCLWWLCCPTIDYYSAIPTAP